MAIIKGNAVANATSYELYEVIGSDYYVVFSENAAFQIEDKGIIVKVDGVKCAIEAGEQYYCDILEVSGSVVLSMNVEGEYDAAFGKNSYNIGEFESVSITLKSNLTVTYLSEK